MRGTILITGFGPFPGAPFNPTAALVRRLADLRRPALSGVRIVTHLFRTSYAAVDRELPALIAHHRPVALLMFGLATRAKTLRIETQARNSLAHRPDADRITPAGRAIARGRPARLPLPAPARRLLAAARLAGVPATLSRDAGSYLCNYLCWRAAEATRKTGGPRLAAFVHVPPIRRNPRPRGRRQHHALTPDHLTRAGASILVALSAGLGSARNHF